MKLEQARVLRDALNDAIARADQSGADEVDLTGTLDARLGRAIGELQEQIDALRKP